MKRFEQSPGDEPTPGDDWLEGASARQTQELRESWTALSQLLASQQVGFEEARMLSGLKRRLSRQRERRNLRLLAMAASVLIVCGATFWVARRMDVGEIAEVKPQGVPTSTGVPTPAIVEPVKVAIVPKVEPTVAVIPPKVDAPKVDTASPVNTAVSNNTRPPITPADLIPSEDQIPPGMQPSEAVQVVTVNDWGWDEVFSTELTSVESAMLQVQDSWRSSNSAMTSFQQQMSTFEANLLQQREL